MRWLEDSDTQSMKAFIVDIGLLLTVQIQKSAAVVAGIRLERRDQADTPASCPVMRKSEILRGRNSGYEQW